MIKLWTGTDMPLIGLGTFKVKGAELVHRTLEAALQAGYRSIDTASVYKNEVDIGNSLKELLPKFGLKREEVFITSKLGPKDHGSGKCRAACLQSINNLQTGYLDLYLIHWPGTQSRKPDDVSNIQSRMESWREMEQLYNEGKCKSIGVSNYEQRHLEELMSECCVKPAVLQIEHHPHLNQSSLVTYCNHTNIHFQAYASLGTTTEDNKLLNDKVVLEIAEVHGKSPAQILLKWAVQQHIGAIPKSTNPDHIQNNIDISTFTLSDIDMDKLNHLDTQHHYCWNPASVI